MISSTEFAQWKQHPVTELLYKDIKDRVHELRDLLESQAGINALEDRQIVGIITGFREILEWKPPTEEEDT